MSADTPDTADWRAIATALGQRVNFAVRNLDCKGAGIIGNFDTPSSEWQHWRDYMADGLDQFPGMTVDREILHTLNLPRRQQKKAQEKIRAERAAMLKARESAA